MRRGVEDWLSPDWGTLQGNTTGTYRYEDRIGDLGQGAGRLHAPPYVIKMLSKLAHTRTVNGTMLLKRLFSDPKPPRGFEKFYRKSGSKPADSTAKPDEKEPPKSADRPKEEEKVPPKEEHGQKEEKKQYGRSFFDEKPGFKNPFKMTFEFPKGPKWPSPIMVAGAALLVYVLFASGKGQEDVPILTFQDLVKRFIEPDQVKGITIHMSGRQKTVPTLFDVSVFGMDDALIGRLKVPEVNSFLRSLEIEQIQMGKDRAHLVPVEYEGPLPGSLADGVETGLKLTNRFTSLILFGLSIWWLIRLRRGKSGKGGSGGGFDIFNMNKANFKVYGTDIKIETRFKDVAGLKEAKMEITEFVDFLKQPQRFKKLGAKIPKGALLVGPPGTGKTLLAKAAAGEAGVPFFAASGSDFVEMFVGLGASRVRQLFKQAKERAPSIIFIDEIDAVGRKRHGKAGGNEERDQTLNQLLVEMDGFGTETNVVVLAGTNRKDILDSALLRPGRFDRTIELVLPDIESREAILKIHLTPIKLNPDVKIEEFARRLAALTPGFSGADLANLCNEAAIMAARKDKSFVDREDFESASERVIGGLEKTKKLSKEEREIVATHEAGHAVAGWFLEGADPLLKVSILPRSKGALGFAQFLPNETALLTKGELLDKICAILSGRAAEELFFGRVTTGAQDDLLRATQIANALVSSLGMNDRLGVVGYNMEQEAFNKPYSEDTNAIIDEEVRGIVLEGLNKARTLLGEKKELVRKLADKLLEKERLVQKDLVEILGARPFALSAEYDKYVNEEQQPMPTEPTEPAKESAKEPAKEPVQEETKKEESKPSDTA